MANARRPDTDVVQMEGQTTVPVVLVMPPDVVPLFSDGLMCNHSEHEFVISFLQVQYPLAVTPEQAKRIKQVENKCVARIVVSASRMESFIEVLKINLDKYRAKHVKQDEE